MTLEALDGFTHLTTHHCVTGSMRHVYAHNGHDVSEEMLLGLGEGVSFSYWHFQGQPPFLGGRGMPKPSMEQLAGQRTGVEIGLHTTTSARKAHQAMLDALDSGQPLMIGCDMGFLPYFDFGGEEYHFGGHAVVVCGYDADTGTVLIADRDAELHPVPLADLERARASTFKPFPPKNLWYTFDFTRKRSPSAGEVREAVVAQARLMLEPPIRNIGVAGIHKAAGAVPRWPGKLNADEVRWALFNTYIFVSPEGGSGGGNFRYMFSRFLAEARELTGDSRLEESAEEFRQVGDDWEALGAWCRKASEADDPAAWLDEAGARLAALAAREEAAWRRVVG
ncbi:MAG TPA: BtrH N-terminal domain-containing protein [Anaerolineae bacterium]|nr:BtrH N-terminal domain-containing protein [Anaerolineae bacterium]